MDQIINNPGLQHITEDILLNLNFKELQVCVFVNKDFQEILQNPIFWLKKWRLKGLSNENHAEWVNAIQLSKNKNLETNILAYIKKIIEVGHFVDVPCFIDKKVVEKVPNNIAYYDFKFAQEFYHCPKSNIDCKTGILQLLAPLTEDPNKKYKKCPQIHVAIENENVDIVRILAPISKTPNAKDQHGQTAISRAAKLGKLEIIEILTPLVNDPNEKDDNGQTPIYHAAKFGHTKIVQFLAPLIKYPNGFEKFFHWSSSSRIARVYGHYEIADFLQSYCQLNNLYL